MKRKIGLIIILSIEIIIGVLYNINSVWDAMSSAMPFLSFIESWISNFVDFIKDLLAIPYFKDFEEPVKDWIVWILLNRLSQVFRYSNVRWEQIIPESFCGMTSLVLSLGVLFGKRDNAVLHFTWLLGLFGGISTVIYATFVGQGASIFYLPTISGLLHHSFSATLVIALLMFKQIDITYKKWYCTIFGFTAYLTVGAFLMHTFNLSDAFHIAEPLLSGTNLTAWVMAPMYLGAYAIILLVVEIIKRKREIQ